MELPPKVAAPGISYATPQSINVNVRRIEVTSNGEVILDYVLALKMTETSKTPLPFGVTSIVMTYAHQCSLTLASRSIFLAPQLSGLIPNWAITY